MTSFSELEGKTLTALAGCDVGSDHITFITECGETYIMQHYYDCCEDVSVEDICGDVDDIIGSPILSAEEVNSVTDTELREVLTAQETLKGTCYDSCTWTFYKIDTAKGGITLRWFGTSNGWYSESVSFEEINYA